MFTMIVLNAEKFPTHFSLNLFFDLRRSKNDLYLFIIFIISWLSKQIQKYTSSILSFITIVLFEACSLSSDAPVKLKRRHPLLPQVVFYFYFATRLLRILTNASH